MPGSSAATRATSPGARTDTAPRRRWLEHHLVARTRQRQPGIVGDDTGREVTSITIGGTPVTYGSSAYIADFPAGLFVGTVTDTGDALPGQQRRRRPSPARSSPSTTPATRSIPTGAVTSVTLSAEGDPPDRHLSTLTAPVTADPLFDATDPTTGWR